VSASSTVTPVSEGVSFIFGHPAQNSSILARVHCPLQAGLNDLAAAADVSCPLDLKACITPGPDGEEQLRVLIQTGSAIAPRHQWNSLDLEVKGQTSGLREARCELLPHVASNQQGDEGADRGFVEPDGHPVQAFVHLAWVKSVGELLVDLMSDVIQIRVDLGPVLMRRNLRRISHTFNVAPFRRNRAASTARGVGR